MGVFKVTEEEESAKAKEKRANGWKDAWKDQGGVPGYSGARLDAYLDEYIFRIDECGENPPLTDKLSKQINARRQFLREQEAALAEQAKQEDS